MHAQLSREDENEKGNGNGDGDGDQKIENDGGLPSLIYRINKEYRSSFFVSSSPPTDDDDDDDDVDDDDVDDSNNKDDLPDRIIPTSDDFERKNNNSDDEGCFNVEYDCDQFFDEQRGRNDNDNDNSNGQIMGDLIYLCIATALAAEIIFLVWVLLNLCFNAYY